MKLQSALLRLVKDGPERRAIDAGEIDAIIDRAHGNVILFPAARRALRAAAHRAPGTSGRLADETPIANSLLAALPRDEHRRLFAGLEPVDLQAGEVLHEPGVPIRYVYFPLDCVVSLLTAIEGHPALEIAWVGHEGMVGISLALEIDVSCLRALVQRSGTALRMESARFRQEALQSAPLQQAFYRYQHALSGQISQSAACNQFHPIRARLARYLLLTADCARSTELRLTQEFLADMLGVRRVGITQAASALQRRRAIKYSRGRLTILDRKRLAAAACGCYRIIRRIYDGEGTRRSQV